MGGGRGRDGKGGGTGKEGPGETHGVDEGAEIEEDGVEGYDAHGLEGVAVDDVGGYDGVAHLDAGGDFAWGGGLLAGCLFVEGEGREIGGGEDGRVCTEEEGDLAGDPVVAFVDADSPDDEADCGAFSELSHHERIFWLTRAEQRSGIREP